MSPRTFPTAETGNTMARRWLTVSVFSLVLAGLFSIVLVIGRTPPLDRYLPDADLFKRSLVVHVNLAFVVWFYAFLGTLSSVVASPGPRKTFTHAGPAAAVAGIFLIVAVPFVTWAPPVLSNYVPVVDHPAFLFGLALFGASLLPGFAALFRRNATSCRETCVPRATAHGVRAAAIAFVLAIATFAAAALAMPAGMPADARYEIVFWGGGHVLQFANVAAMTACWFLLLGAALGREPIGGRTARALYAVFLLPLVLAPYAAYHGIQTGSYRFAFTRLMQFGIFPVVMAILALCVRAIVRERRNGLDLRGAWRSPWLPGFAASAALSVAGFAFGAAIKGSNTVIPAHYHASIGAVTVAFMSASYLFVHRWGYLPDRASVRRAACWQPAIYGFGQVVFALGFGLAGMQGLARKTYGAEQHIRTGVEKLGLGIMATGGAFAVAGGILFLWIMAHAYRTARERTTAGNHGRISWPLKIATGIFFRN
ncbi:cbb3-type cytochrome c oxidase subunit I [bacterium]|nr:cbb3-type cytochrome c oxidase subunit I [bacterium]